MAAYLAGADGETKKEIKKVVLKTMYDAMNQVLRAHELRYGSSEADRSFRYAMTSDDRLCDFNVKIRIRETRVYFTASWTKKVPDEKRGAFAVFSMVCNDKLEEGNLEMDHSDGEVRFTVCMPVGYMAEKPGGMLMHYHDLLHDGAKVCLRAALLVVDKDEEPIATGAAAAEALQAVRAAK